MPDRINTSPCLQRYLDALPRSEYFGKGYQVEATDGLSWLNRSSTKEPAMGAGVMWHDAAISHRSERVGVQHSSTRLELAAVVMVLQGTPRADDLAILIDSAAAIQRLRWFRSHEYDWRTHAPSWSTLVRRTTTWNGAWLAKQVSRQWRPRRTRYITFESFIKCWSNHVRTDKIERRRSIWM